MQKISVEAARVNAKLTQEELAEKMGVSRKTICNWESGKKSMRKSNLIAFCTITGFSEEDLFLPGKFA